MGTARASQGTDDCGRERGPSMSCKRAAEANTLPPAKRAEPAATICLISVCDQAYAEAADANKRAYCEKHGYVYRSYNAPLDDSRHIAWSKVIACLQLLPDYSWVMWTDAD